MLRNHTDTVPSVGRLLTLYLVSGLAMIPAAMLFALKVGSGSPGPVGYALLLFGLACGLTCWFALNRYLEHRAVSSRTPKPSHGIPASKAL